MFSFIKKQSHPLNHFKSYGGLWVVLCVAVLLRLLFFGLMLQHPERAMYGDSSHYTHLAQNLLQGHGYSASLEPPRFPESRRPWGYPLFLLGLFWCMGEKLMPIIFLQNIIDLVTVALVFLIGRQLYSHRAGIFAAGFYAVSPIPLIYNQFIMSETLFLVFFMAGIFSLLVAIEQNSLRAMILGAIFLGAAATVRPMAGWLGGLLAAYSLLWKEPGFGFWSWRLNLKRFFVVLIFLLLLSPFMIRNYLAFRQFFYSVSGKSVFIISHVSATIARAEKKELPRVCDDFIARTYLNHPRLMEKYQVPGTDRGSILGLPADALYDPQALDFCVQDGLRQLIKYPQVYFLGIVENMLRLCLLPMQRSENLTHFFGLVQISPAPLREPFLALLHEKKYFKAAAYIWQRRVQPLPPGLQFFWVWIFIFESALFVFAALGLLRISRFEKKSLAVFFAWSGFLTVCFFFFSSGLYSELRYRFPCEPFFAVLAGYYLSARKDASENF